MKAFQLLKEKSADERSVSIVTSVKRNLQKNVLDILTEKKERLEDEILEASTFTEDLSRDFVENRFMQLIQAEYKLKLITKELEAKQEIFDEYFKD